MMRSEVGTEWPVVMAGALLAALPIVLLFLMLHRWLWRGVGLMYDEV
jgi:ABC-type glycerol-3-phosphate transport system permease component